MARATIDQISAPINPSPGNARRVQRILLAAFLIQFVVVWSSLAAGFPDFGNAHWPDGLLLLLCAASLLGSASRQLPTQNVFLATAIIIVISTMAHAVG